MFWMLLALAWLISPIVLLPMGIHKARKADRYERFINDLYAKSRITDYEKEFLSVDGSVKPAEQNKKEDRYIQKSPQPKPAPDSRWVCECGYKNNISAKSCSSCGRTKAGLPSVTYNAKPASRTWVCIECGLHNNDSFSFCAKCGSKKPAIISDNTAENIWGNTKISKPDMNVAASVQDSAKNNYAPVDSANAHSNMGDTIKTVQQTNIPTQQNVQAEASPVQKKWTCPSCGKENTAIARFCAKCGIAKSAAPVAEKAAESAAVKQEEKKDRNVAAAVSDEKKITAPKTVQSSAPLFRDNEKPQVVKAPAHVRPVKEKKHYDSSTILFGIGVVFVILAGIIFSTAFWVKWSDLTRTGVIALASIFFFGISWLSKKKFKLESTSGAMFVTGSVFTAITVITAGLLKIFGEDFSLEGDMKWLFYMSGILILGICSYSAEKIYKKPECRYLTLLSMATGVTFMTAQFAAFTAEPSKVFGLLTAVLGAAGSAVFVRFSRKEKGLSKPTLYIFLLFRGLYFLAGAATLFTEFINMSGFSIWGWGITLLTIFECFIYMFGYEQKIYPISLLVESFMVGLAAFQLSYEFNDKTVYAYVITGFGLITTAIYNYIAAKGKNIVDATFEKYALRIFFALLTLPRLLINFTQWDICEWVLLGVWTAEMLTYSGIYKKFGHMLAGCLLIEAGVLEMLIGEYFPAENIALAVTLSAVAVGAVFNTLKKKGKELVDTTAAYTLLRILLTLTVIPVIVKVHSVPLSEIGWTICAIFLVEELVYGILFRTNGYLMLHGIVLLFMLSKAREASFLDGYFTLAVTVFAALAYIVYIKTESFNCDAVVYFIRCGMGLFAAHDLLEHFFSWQPQDIAVYLILLAELTTYAILKNSRFILALQCIFVVAGNLQLADNTDPDKFIFFSWLFVAVSSVVYVLLRHKRKTRFDADIVIGSMRVLYGLLLVALAINMTNNPFNAWHLGTLLLLMAETAVYAVVARSNMILCIHGAVMMAALIAIKDAGWFGRYFTLYVTLFAIIAYAVYYIIKKQNKLIFNADKAVYIIRAALGTFMAFELCRELFIWQPLHWVVFGLSLAELTVYAVLEKSERILALQCIFIVWGNITLMDTKHIDMFTFFSWLFIAAGTLVYVTLRRKNKTRFDPDLTVICMRVAYAFLIIPVVQFLFNSQVNGWVLGSILLVTIELGYYGIVLNNRYMLFSNCVCAITALAAACSMLQTNLEQVDVHTAQFIFSAGLTVLILIYRYVKAISTKASDALLMAVLFGNSLMLLREACVPYGIISMMAFELFIILISFSDKHYLAKAARLLMSVPVLMTCDYLCRWIGRPMEGILYTHAEIDAYKVMIHSGTAMVLAAVAYAVGFGIKQDSKKYSPMKYSFEGFGILALASAFMSLPHYIDNGADTMIFIGCAMMIASAVILYSVTQTDRNNLLSIIPLAELYYAVGKIFNITTYGYGTQGNFTIPISILLFAALAIVSRSRNSESLRIVTEDGKKIYDTASIGVLFGLPLCTEGTWFNSRAVMFVMLLEIAAFLANLYRTKNSEKTNKLLLTLSAGTVGAALIVRPFMVFDGTIWMTKIIIAIVVLFGIAMKYIWRDNERFADESSKGIFMVAYVLLLIDGLMNQTVANSIIVLCTSLAIMLFAFRIRSKRWFLISAAGLAGLTLYTTKDFFASLAWWLYLLIAGLLLIAIASVNEYLKGKGKNLKDVTSSYLDTWKW